MVTTSPGSPSRSPRGWPPWRVRARVSSASLMVKDLVAGSGLAFEDAGEHELKGVPDPGTCSASWVERDPPGRTVRSASDARPR